MWRVCAAYVLRMCCVCGAYVTHLEPHEVHAVTPEVGRPLVLCSVVNPVHGCIWGGGGLVAVSGGGGGKWLYLGGGGVSGCIWGGLVAGGGGGGG